MDQPSWEDREAGGVMVRAALWLVEEVGQGNTFTKNQLRDAFPGVAQADRRIRDLRDYGWVIYSSAEDATLSREEQRLVSVGVPVWNTKARRAGNPRKGISSTERQAVLRRDGYVCTTCGIAAGEPYADDPAVSAVLSVSSRSTEETAAPSDQLFTECKRCRAGGGGSPATANDVLSAAGRLSAADLSKLARRIERGERELTELDRAWTLYLRLPGDQREPVGAELRRLLAQSPEPPALDGDR